MKKKMKKNIIEEKSINDINYELLKKQFPSAVSIDEDGKYTIDPQKLQMSLDPSKAEIKEDGYGLNWVGKKEAYHNAYTKNYKVLKPLKQTSKDWDNTENILIKGDNIDALKILRHNYFESIKMIYIDPPYNTKNDGFVYNDNFTTTTAQTLEDLGYDKEYVDYIENIHGAKTHSGWLSFMYPRLLLAKDLLKEDGVIFISIDDNEVAQLRLLCDEVFGEENFVAQITVVVKTEGRRYGFFAKTHEQVLVYSKNTYLLELNEIEVETKSYKFEDKNGGYNIQELRNQNARAFNSTNRPNLRYPLYVDLNQQDENGFSKVYLEKMKNLTEVYPITINGFESVWRWGRKEKATLKLNDLIARKGNDDIVRIYQKVKKLSEMPKTVFTDKKYVSIKGTRELQEMLGLGVFDFPKPLDFIKLLLNIGTNKTDIILDFFAGSGTTAHAVMDLNSADGGSRKYILVQWAEQIDSKKNKTAYDFVKDELKSEEPTIFDITVERIKRAGERIVENDLTKKCLDIGFRAFEIVEDQGQKIYQKSLEEVEQEDLLVFIEKPNIKSNEEILYNLFVADGLSLCTKYEELIDEKLYLASNVAFVLGDVGSDELVEVLENKKECEYITIYSPNISDDKFTLEIESNISKLGIKPDKIRFRG